MPVKLDCPLQERCPGCPLGNQAYEHGLESKARSLMSALARYSTLTPEALPPRAAVPTLSYRLRAKLVVAGKSLGLFERGSHRVIDVQGCRVLSPELTSACELLRQALPLPIYGADLRATSEGVLLTLLTDSPAARSQLEALAPQLVRQGLLSVAVGVRPAGNVRLLAGEPTVVAGPGRARYRASEELPYGYAAPGGFVQAHGGQAAYVQRGIVAGLKARLGALEGRRLLELFAGNGSLALLLARAGAAVTAVESYAPAIALAERAAREQQLTLSAVTADATRYTQAVAPGQRFDAAIVNPPRRGLSVTLRRALGSSSIGTLAYVSCNPRTLARDAWHLGQLGLSLTSVEPLDMIPWSDAVEVLAWFERRAPLPPRVLFDQDGWLAVDKPPWQTVRGGLLELVRETLGRDAVAVDDWGQATGVCWFARGPSAAAQLSRALEEGERELSVLVRGNLRKQGTVMRRRDGQASPGARYRKVRDVGRHSLASVVIREALEHQVLLDFASIAHPVLGDAAHGDQRSNEHVEHRHGLDRAFIHCRKVSLRAPSGALLEVTSELSPDLAEAESSLGSD